MGKHMRSLLLVLAVVQTTGWGSLDAQATVLSARDLLTKDHVEGTRRDVPLPSKPHLGSGISVPLTPTPSPSGRPTPQPSAPVPTSHTFTFANDCTEDIWVGTLSNPGFALIANGGFRLQERAAPVAIQVPVGWQGRFWARVACNFTHEGICDPPFQPCCASGSCLNSDGKFGIHCAHAGLMPMSLVELSLDNPSPYGPYDVYDVSLVGGWSVPLSIVPVNGTYNKHPDPGVLAPWCELTGCAFAREFARSPCPSPLQVVGTTVSCWSPCQAAINNGASKEHIERVCCVCTMSQPLCDCASTNDPTGGHTGCCTGGYGCTPYHTPPYQSDTVCNPWALNQSRAWPQKDLDFINVIEVACRKVYTWQFDDTASTVQCRKTNGLVDYDITFSGSRNERYASDSTSTSPVSSTPASENPHNDKECATALTCVDCTSNTRDKASCGWCQDGSGGCYTGTDHGAATQQGQCVAPNWVWASNDCAGGDKRPATSGPSPHKSTTTALVVISLVIAAVLVVLCVAGVRRYLPMKLLKRLVNAEAKLRATEAPWIPEHEYSAEGAAEYDGTSTMRSTDRVTMTTETTDSDLTATTAPTIRTDRSINDGPEAEERTGLLSNNMRLKQAE